MCHRHVYVSPHLWCCCCAYARIPDLQSSHKQQIRGHHRPSARPNNVANIMPCAVQPHVGQKAPHKCSIKRFSLTPRYRPPACLQTRRQLSVTATPHRVFEAVESTVLVGFVRPHAHARPCGVCNGVAGNGGVVCVTGDTCRV